MKQQTHGLYEIARSKEASPAEVAKAEREGKELWQQVPVPKGAIE